MSETRCMAALFERPPSLQTLEALLRALGTVRLEADGLVLEADGGEVRVDPFPLPWPGEADLRAQPDLEAAFSAGAFGSGTAPQSFQRAVEHPWTCRDARRVAPDHQAFVRLLLPATDAVLPEWMRLTRAVAALAAAPGALCAFTPAGESLRAFHRVQAALHAIGEVPAPADLWVNTRLISLGPRWQAMDTVGMAQLEQPDLVALYDTAKTTYRGADAFLRNLCLYLLDGGALRDGDRLPGPDGEEWEVRASDQALLAPERPTLQLAAVGGPDLGVVAKG